MTLKEIAKDFLTKCAFENPREAFQLYVAENCLHHNPYFKSELEALKIAMEEGSRVNPIKLFDIKLMIQEDNFVSVHSRIVQEKEDVEYAVVHILKFEDEKIVELWDVIQNVPEELINVNGMF